MAVETHWTAVGGPAFEVLVGVVDRAKGADPMQPVTVVTPTPAAAVRLRRELARRRGGIAAVHFQALDDLAEQLAAPHLDGDVGTGIDREVVIAAVRAELVDRPGRFGPAAGHRSTWETLAATVQEIAVLDPDARSALARAGPLPAEAVRVHDAVAASVGVGGRLDVHRAAESRLVRSSAVLSEIGPVVVHLPGRLDPPARRLLSSLATRGELVVIGGLSGVERADQPVVDSVVALGGTAPVDTEQPVPAPPTEVISTNDVDDEIHAAVRALLGHADRGVPLHAMALVHPPGEPYARSVAEALRSAGIPFSGPSAETLGHTAPGRVLLGLLDVRAEGFSREAVVDLWSTGLIVDADHRPMLSVRLDHRSRRLGVVGGLADWTRTITGRREWLTEHPVEPVPDDPELTRRRQTSHETELDELDELQDAVGTLAALVDGLPTTWADVGDWAGHVLETLCGPRARRTEWPDHELDAGDRICTSLRRLSALEEIEPAPTVAVVVDTIRAVLESPAPRRGGSGAGLQVSSLTQPPVVPMSAVAVVGLVEGHVPRVGREDVLLSDTARAAAGLPVADDATVDQQRDLAAALAAGAETRILTYARCDQRSGRTQVPSRWLLDALEASTGARPRTEDLISGVAVPGVEIVASHRGALVGAAQSGVAVHADEHRLADLAVADDVDSHPAVLDPVLASGATLARHRSADAYTRFDGNVDSGVDLLADGRHRSPTGIETYATCPRRWFFGRALGIGEIDRPEEVERLQPSDKGSLAHLILERFIGEAIDTGSVPAPGESWGSAGFERIGEIADEEFADFERRGLTGHPRWWAFEREEIVDVLCNTLRHDDAIRYETGTTPVAVEFAFGRDGVQPLPVELADGRVVPLAGQADRVDEGPGEVRVYDYKYASARPFRGLDKPVDAGGDPLDRGRRLQLVAYAEAAARQRGVDRSSAWYWFLRPGHTGVRIGYQIEPEHRAMFRETLRVLLDGIDTGEFPARSGPHDWFFGTNENCGFCEFDAICPADRDDEWERVRADDALVDLVRLAEEGSPALVDAETAETAETADTDGDDTTGGRS